MMRSLRHISVILAIVLTLVIGFDIQPSFAKGSSSIRRPQEEMLQNYSGQTMIGAEFNGADLNDADFSGANLEAAVFRGTDLTGANFSGANLANAFFFQSTLDKANLTNANFEDAFLMQTSFKGATVDGADFSYASISNEHFIVLCELAKGTNPVTGMDTKDSLVCP